VQPRRFSYLEIAISAAIINTLINAPLGWALVPADALLPTWGLPGVAFDLVATAFGIAAGTVLVVTPQIRRQRATGKLAAPVLSDYWREGFARWPSAALKRALNVAVLTVLVSTPLPLAALAVLGTEGLDRPGYTLLKGAFAFVVGGLVTPVIAAAAAIEQKAEN
jgi:hypothetical protein